MQSGGVSAALLDGRSVGQEAGVMEPAPEVVEVAGLGRCLDDFLDDGEEVSERADGFEAAGVGAECPARGREDEGVFHDVERDAAVVQGECRPAIIAQDSAEGSGQVLVLRKESRDVRSAGLHLRDLGERRLDVLGGDGPGARESGGEQRVMSEEIDLARQAAGGLKERLVGGRLEE
jgi:hypothetical protein